MSEEIIKIEHVSKEYRLGMIGGTTLRDELQRKSAKLRGKEDPTRKVTDTSAGNAGERFLALDDINLTINKGERVGIIGHNGAGKSTLLKLLSRITAPSRGSIELNGRIASMLEVGTGFHGELSGRENIYMNGAILGMSKAEIDSKMEDIIEFSECRQFIDTPVKRYSSGMYVKLAFSVAAHLDSEIMIMDEVLAVGDMQFQKKCLDKMNDVSRKEGRTILYVSHNMNTIRQLCDRCIVLDHGKLIFDGDVEQAINIYLGRTGDGDFPICYDFSNKKRNLHFGKEIKANYWKFLNCNSASFEANNNQKAEISIDSKIDICDCSIAIKIYDSNRFQLGMSLSEPIPIKKGNNIFTFLIPIKSLSHGDYIINFEIIKIDENGNYYSYDNPAAQIIFRVSNRYAHGIVWNKNYFGAMSFPSSKVINEKDY